jgi:uncharacterized protein (TIGR02391 family)
LCGTSRLSDPLQELRGNVGRIATSIRLALTWLRRTQATDGRWPDSTVIMELTGTSQATAALLEAGYPATDRYVSRALSWLVSRHVDENIRHRFWRLLPLAEAGSAYQPYVDQDLRYLIDMIKSGVKIDVNIDYNLFLLDCVSRTSFRPAIDIGRYVSYARTAVRSGEERPPYVALWNVVLLELLLVPLPQETFDDALTSVLKLFTTSAKIAAPTGFESIAAMSYLTINLCRSHTFRKSAVDLVHQMVIRIIDAQRRTGFWEKESGLYGGLPGRPYITGLATRALVQCLLTYEPRAIAQTHVTRARTSRGRNAQTKQPAHPAFYGIHPEIIEKCSVLYEAGAYAEAVEKSFKVVRDRLRTLTQFETSAEAFGKGKLYISGAAARHVDRYFNEAAKFLMMAIDRFRNEKSHTSDGRIQDPVRAHQYLAVSSLAMYLLDDAKTEGGAQR